MREWMRLTGAMLETAGALAEAGREIVTAAARAVGERADGPRAASRARVSQPAPGVAAAFARLLQISTLPKG